LDRERLIGVKKVIINSNYANNNNKQNHDIALVQLKQEVPLSHQVGIACLPSRRMATWCQFHQRSMSIFYARRSQKHQMTLLT